MTLTCEHGYGNEPCPICDGHDPEHPTVEDLDRLWLDAYHRHMDTNWQLGQGDYADQLTLARQAGIRAILDALTDAAAIAAAQDA